MATIATPSLQTQRTPQAIGNLLSLALRKMEIEPEFSKYQFGATLARDYGPQIAKRSGLNAL